MNTFEVELVSQAGSFNKDEQLLRFFFNFLPKILEHELIEHL